MNTCSKDSTKTPKERECLSKIVFFRLFCQKLVNFNVVLLTITHFSTIKDKIIREVLACSLKCMQNYANVYSEKHKNS